MSIPVLFDLKTFLVWMHSTAYLSVFGLLITNFRRSEIMEPTSQFFLKGCEAQSSIYVYKDL